MGILRPFVRAALERSDLEKYAQQTGLDLARFKKALDSGAHRAAIQRDADQALALGATGTPAFFVNGKYAPGALSFEKFKLLVDEQLAVGH